jgi:hypothetical protein
LNSSKNSRAARVSLSFAITPIMNRGRTAGRGLASVLRTGQIP